MYVSADLIWLAVALPLAGFLLNGALAIWRPQAKTAVSVIGAGVLLASFAVVAVIFRSYAAARIPGPVIVPLWSWLPVGSLRIDLSFLVDQLSLVMMLVVTGVGSLIHLFSVGYMRQDASYARYFSFLNLFVVFMLVLVLGASFPVLFIGWEGVGLCSYLLIGFWFGDKVNADAGKKAFLVNRIGDFGFMVAMFLIWMVFGTLDFTAVSRLAPEHLAAGGAMVTAITLFLFLGCTGKSAQIPLYVWLPDAMAGPTPVSALIHAATMVTAGVYLVARTGALFALAPLSSAVVAGVGAATALIAATIGLRQYDIKKVLAYSTVSQLGFMFLAVGSGAYVAGIFHLATHAFFKALLFLGAGSVIHAMHHAYHATHSHEDPQDMRNMGGLRTRLPWTFVLMVVATLAIAGIPPLSGFFSKDEILAAAFARGAEVPVFRLFWLVGVVTAGLTAFYMARLIAMTFLGGNRTGKEEAGHLHDAPAIMTGPLVALGILTAVGGVINLPALVGGHHWLESWLEPTLEEAHRIAPLEMPHGQVEYGLVALAILVAVVGLVLGFRRTLAQPIVPAREAPAEQGFWKVLFNKYYVDELYEAVIVGPLRRLSERILWKDVDQRLIDRGGVEGAAGLSRTLGWLGTRLQTGQVGVYLMVFLVGALGILLVVMG